MHQTESFLAIATFSIGIKALLHVWIILGKDLCNLAGKVRDLI